MVRILPMIRESGRTDRAAPGTIPGPHPPYLSIRHPGPGPEMPLPDAETKYPSPLFPVQCESEPGPLRYDAHSTGGRQAAISRP